MTEASSGPGAGAVIPGACWMWCTALRMCFSPPLHETFLPGSFRPRGSTGSSLPQPGLTHPSCARLGGRRGFIPPATNTPQRFPNGCSGQHWNTFRAARPAAPPRQGKSGPIYRSASFPRRAGSSWDSAISGVRSPGACAGSARMSPACAAPRVRTWTPMPWWRPMKSRLPWARPMRSCSVCH